LAPSIGTVLNICMPISRGKALKGKSSKMLSGV